MEQQHQKPAATTAAPTAASTGSSSSSFLGVSSSTHSQFQLRRSLPLLYPPPPAPLPGHLASRSYAAASGASASGSSSSQSQFHQISPSPGAAAKRCSRPNSRITHSLPTPFLSELTSIRRTGTNFFADLNKIQRPLLHGQQQQEMTWPSTSLSMPHSHYHTPIPIAHSSGLPSTSQQALQQQQQEAQPSFSSLHPPPGGNFSRFPLPVSQTHNMQPSSSFSSTSVPVLPKLILGGMDKLDRPGLPPRLPIVGAGASSSKSRSGGTKEEYFSDAEIETINNDNGLKELVKTDSNKVRRILRNRKYVARLRMQKVNHFKELMCRADALKTECNSLSAQVQSQQEMFDNLKAEIREAQIKLKGLKELDNLKQELNCQLQSELQRLKS